MVEKVWVFLAGTVVLRLIRVVMTPPAVSRPRDSGVTSKRRRSESFSLLSAPERMAAWTVAPNATASSGLIDLHDSFPLKKIRKHRLDLGNTGGTSNQYYLVHLTLCYLRISQYFLTWIHALLELVHAQVLKPGTRNCGIVVNTVKKGVYLNVCLSGR